MWGRKPFGLTEREVQEANLAYDEYDRLNAARRAWTERQREQHDAGVGRRGKGRASRSEKKFDATAYIEERRQQLLDELEAEEASNDEAFAEEL